MKPYNVILFVVFVLLTGCATKPIQPDWINGDSATYKSAQYLIGRGQSSTQEEAKDRARADIAKVFQVAVVVDSEDVQTFKSLPTGNGEGQYENQVSRHVSTRTDQIVNGIQIAELWQDPTSKTYYVLVILPRLQTAAGLRQQIGQLDEVTGNYISQSRNQTDLFLKIAAANQALESQQDRDALQKSLQVVDITGRGLEAQWNSAKLRADLDALLKRVRIATQTTDDSPSGFDVIVSGALAQAGFLIETGKQPDFTLQARLNLTDLGLKEGWYWQRGTIEITLTEVGAGRVRGTQRWAVKSSAPDKESSIKRALNQADLLLKQELGTAIIKMFTVH
jgi:hypothetical protein